MYKSLFKRFFDLIFSLISLPFFLIIFIIIGFTTKFQDKGPIFYNAPRLGKNGEIFKMYKFRSMKVNAPDIRNTDGSTFNAENDPRLTKVGKFIRKTSLDETPQLLNVIKGNMSIIGPRPDLVEHLKMYELNEERKLEVRPGITGFNQAYYRNTIPWKKRIQKDIYYIDNLSFWLDVKIFIKTISSLLKRDDVFIKNEQSNSIEKKDEDIR